MAYDFDIYRTANLLVKLHGADCAKLHAAKRADEMLAKNDPDGCRKWARVLKAIEELATTQKPPDATSH